MTTHEPNETKEQITIKVRDFIGLLENFYNSPESNRIYGVLDGLCEFHVELTEEELEKLKLLLQKEEKYHRAFDAVRDLIGNKTSA